MDHVLPRRSAVIKEIYTLLKLPEANQAPFSGLPNAFFTSVASELGINTLQDSLGTARSIVEYAHLEWLPEFFTAASDGRDNFQITTLGLLQIKNAILVWQGHEPVDLPEREFIRPWMPNPLWHQLRENLPREEAEFIPRPGATKFREMVLSIYENSCAISGVMTAAALDAAHIIPYYGPESDVIQNGIALRSDLHRLLDHGLIKIEKSEKSENLCAFFHHSVMVDYQELNGSKLKVPVNRNFHPSEVALEIKNSLSREIWN
jgi:hypothetical protein